MKRDIKWPNGYDFAFTIVDDTDGATLENIKPVYDYLYEKGIITTKTCWVFPPRDDVYKGDSFERKEYLDYLKLLKKRGFEIGFHNAGSGTFNREETLEALEKFKNELGEYPSLHINHSNNTENIYWGGRRFSSKIVKFIYNLRRSEIASLGTKKNSEYFWGDFVKENVKYIRNRTFNGINTLKIDPKFVYRETGKEEFSNYWFSSSDGMRLSSMLSLLKKENVDKLIKENGACIAYTHFGYEFVDENGDLNEDFKKAIDYIASKNGWFVPAGTLLDYILEDKDYKPSKWYEKNMDIKWFLDRIKKG